jgi:hypothetical protein
VRASRLLLWGLAIDDERQAASALEEIEAALADMRTDRTTITRLGGHVHVRSRAPRREESA